MATSVIEREITAHVDLVRDTHTWDYKNTAWDPKKCTVDRPHSWIYCGHKSCRGW